MQGSLENSAGQEMRRWIFQPPVRSLQPGERATVSYRVRVGVNAKDGDQVNTATASGRFASGERLR